MYKLKKHYKYYESSGKNPLLKPLHLDFGNIYTDRREIYNNDIEVIRPITYKNEETNLEYCIGQSVLNIQSQNKRIILMFSGGLDSTLVLTALNQRGVSFYITMNKYTMREAPEISRDIISGKYKNIRVLALEKALEYVKDKNYLFVTGELGDQIVGTDRIFPYLFHGTLGVSTDKYYKYISEKSVDILRNTTKDIIKLDTVFDVLWWLNFNFKYQNVQLRSIKLGLSISRNVIHFFDTEEFNNYSITTIKDNMPTSVFDYKQRYKEYIYINLGYGDFLKSKTKQPSLKEIL